VSLLAVGSHTITVKATDALDNVGQASVTVVIKAPTSTTSKTTSTTTSNGGGIPGFELTLLLATLPLLYIYRKNKKN
jgi:hypothetical protein